MTKSSSHGSKQCNKTFVSPQSLLNHKQRCRVHTGNISSNDIDEKNVHRKRLWDDCAGLNAAADKTRNPSKNPKIQSLSDEIINNGSTEHYTTLPEKKSSVDVFGKTVLPLSPPTIVAGVFREKPQPKASPPEVVADTFQEKVLPTPPSEVVAGVFQEEPSSEIESPPRTKSDIIGYSDGEDDEHSDTDESIDNSSDEIKLLPTTVDGVGKRLRKLWTEFMRE